jgi:hypothetical protein
MPNTSEKNRKIMSFISIAVGVVMMAVVPFLVQTSLERVLTHLLEHSKTHPAFTSGLKLFDLFYPIWRAIIFVAGAALIVISQEIKKGEKWAYSLAMLLFALPAMGGMFMFLPYVSFVPGFPLPMTISLIGLVGFWSFIFLREGTRIEKWTRFAALTLIGMLATHAFTIGIGAQRQMMTRAGYPLYESFEVWMFNWVGEVNWVAFILLVASIPLLAVGSKRGWWLATIGAVAILLIDVPTQFVRTSTFDYLIGAALASGVLIFTGLPYFRRHLLAEEAGVPAAEPTAELRERAA